MAISILAVMLGMEPFTKRVPDPEPMGFVVGSMWLNFILMIVFSIQSLWPILVLVWELFKEFGAGALVKLRVWSDLIYLNRVIEIAKNPQSKIPARLGTRRSMQIERFDLIARSVERVRQNLMRGVERRRAARRTAARQDTVHAAHLDDLGAMRAAAGAVHATHLNDHVMNAAIWPLRAGMQVQVQWV